MPLRWHVKRKALAPEAIKWGLHSVAVCSIPLPVASGTGRKADHAQTTLKFINKDASSIHGNINVGSVYTTESGEWKLGGFDVLSAVNDDEAIIYVSCYPRLRAFRRCSTMANLVNRPTAVWCRVSTAIRRPSCPTVVGTP